MVSYKCFWFIFFYCLDSLYKAQKAAKKMESDGLVADTELEKSDLDRKSRKKRTPSRFRDSEEEDDNVIPASSKKAKIAAHKRIYSSDSETEGIPPPVVNFEELQSKVNKIVAERQVRKTKETSKFNISNFSKSVPGGNKVNTASSQSKRQSSNVLHQKHLKNPGYSVSISADSIQDADDSIDHTTVHTKGKSLHCRC